MTLVEQVDALLLADRAREWAKQRQKARSGQKTGFRSKPDCRSGERAYSYETKDGKRWGCMADAKADRTGTSSAEKSGTAPGSEAFRSSAARATGVTEHFPGAGEEPPEDEPEDDGGEEPEDGEGDTLVDRGIAAAQPDAEPEPIEPPEEPEPEEPEAEPGEEPEEEPVAEQQTGFTGHPGLGLSDDPEDYEEGLVDSVDALFHPKVK